MDGVLIVCVDCGYEWLVDVGVEVGDELVGDVVKDVNGNVLLDGDLVVLIKDLCVKGLLIMLKMGIKVKSIWFVGGDYEVDCKIDMGGFMLKVCYLKKV